jgi:hypothetical protein
LSLYRGLTAAVFCSELARHHPLGTSLQPQKTSLYKNRACYGRVEMWLEQGASSIAAVRFPANHSPGLTDRHCSCRLALCSIITMNMGFSRIHFRTSQKPRPDRNGALLSRARGRPISSQLSKWTDERVPCKRSHGPSSGQQGYEPLPPAALQPDLLTDMLCSATGAIVIAATAGRQWPQSYGDTRPIDP